MRLTGLALFVLSLSHFLILHVLYDPKDQTAAFIANVRWSSLFWRANDWLFLTVRDRPRRPRHPDRRRRLPQGPQPDGLS